MSIMRPICELVDIISKQLLNLEKDDEEAQGCTPVLEEELEGVCRRLETTVIRFKA